jgi:hypothetical protein
MALIVTVTSCVPNLCWVSSWVLMFSCQCLGAHVSCAPQVSDLRYQAKALPACLSSAQPQWPQLACLTLRLQGESDEGSDHLTDTRCSCADASEYALRVCKRCPGCKVQKEGAQPGSDLAATCMQRCVHLSFGNPWSLIISHHPLASSCAPAAPSAAVCCACNI